MKMIVFKYLIICGGGNNKPRGDQVFEKFSKMPYTKGFPADQGWFRTGLTIQSQDKRLINIRLIIGK